MLSGSSRYCSPLDLGIVWSKLKGVRSSSQISLVVSFPLVSICSAVTFHPIWRCSATSMKRLRSHVPDFFLRGAGFIIRRSAGFHFFLYFIVLLWFYSTGGAIILIFCSKLILEKSCFVVHYISCVNCYYFFHKIKVKVSLLGVRRYFVYNVLVLGCMVCL